MQLFVFVGFAFNYQDGGNESIKHSRKITYLPSYFNYLSFMLFPPACLVGPVYEYNDHYNMIERKDQFSVIPDTKWAILGELKIFLISAVIYVVGGMYFPM